MNDGNAAFNAAGPLGRLMREYSVLSVDSDNEALPLTFAAYCCLMPTTDAPLSNPPPGTMEIPVEDGYEESLILCLADGRKTEGVRERRCESCQNVLGLWLRVEKGPDGFEELPVTGEYRAYLCQCTADRRQVFARRNRSCPCCGCTVGSWLLVSATPLGEATVSKPQSSEASIGCVATPMVEKAGRPGNADLPANGSGR